MSEGRGFSTRAVHGGTPPVDQETPSVPIYQTSTYRFDSSEDYAETIAFRAEGYTYSRGYGNPTVQAFEAQMAALEGTEAAFGFASGMAAIHTVIMAHAEAGARLVFSNELYGGTYSIATRVLPKLGVEVDLVDPHDLEAVRAALPGAALFHVETIANPNVTVADLEALGALCGDAGVPASVDNTFASPYLCTPARLGFEYVIHSATKYLGGHHDLIGGVVCTSSEGRCAPAGRRDRHRRHDEPVRGVAVPAGADDPGASHGSPRRQRHGARRDAGRTREGRARPLPRPRVPPAARGRREGAPARVRRDDGGRGRRRGRGWSALLRRARARVGRHQPGRHPHAGGPRGLHHPPSDGSGGTARGRASPTGWCASASGIEDPEDILDDMARALEKV